MIEMVDLSKLEYAKFEKLKEEEWNEYKLKDGSVILLKTVVFWLRLLKEGKKGTLKCQCKLGKIIVPAPELCGKPASSKYKDRELRESIVDKDIAFDLVKDSWNKYLLEDGINIWIKRVLSKASRTSKFDEWGEPIYVIEDQLQWKGFSVMENGLELYVEEHGKK